MVTVALLESGICTDPGFMLSSVHLDFFVLSASETGLLLVVKLGRNVVMMRAGVKIMHQSNPRRPLKYRVKKCTYFRQAELNKDRLSDAGRIESLSQSGLV